MRLRRPSFFLPAGEVVFKVLANPTQIPDSPPIGVSLRHCEAMDAFPGATFYYLRPVFSAVPHLRLQTAADLRQEAANDFENIHSAVRIHGPSIRTMQWLRSRMIDLARRCLQGGTRVVETVNYLLAPAERKRLMRLARSAEAPSLGNDYTGPGKRAERAGLAREAQQFRRAARRLQSTFDFDPILCFEVDSQPGKLWFEAHWYQAQDGRTYVHY